MKITPDTNVLVRALMDDDSQQALAARRCLAEAEAIVLTLPALCETGWVLSSFYGVSRAEVAAALRTLTAAATAIYDEAAVALGLQLLEAGGDFADGVIAARGVSLGADAFVSFDRQALRLVADAGLTAISPGG